MLYTEKFRAEVVTAFDYTPDESCSHTLGYERILGNLTMRMTSMEPRIRYFDDLNVDAFADYYAEFYTYFSLGELMDHIVLEAYGVVLHRTRRFC